MDRIETLEAHICELREQLADLTKAEDTLACAAEIVRVEHQLLYA